MYGESLLNGTIPPVPVVSPPNTRRMIGRVDGDLASTTPQQAHKDNRELVLSKTAVDIPTSDPVGGISTVGTNDPRSAPTLTPTTSHVAFHDTTTTPYTTSSGVGNLEHGSSSWSTGPTHFLEQHGSSSSATPTSETALPAWGPASLAPTIEFEEPGPRADLFSRGLPGYRSANSLAPSWNMNDPNQFQSVDRNWSKTASEKRNGNFSKTSSSNFSKTSSDGMGLGLTSGTLQLLREMLLQGESARAERGGVDALSGSSSLVSEVGDETNERGGAARGGAAGAADHGAKGGTTDKIRGGWSNSRICYASRFTI